MIYLIVFFAIVFSVYINQRLQKKRDLRKENMRERREEQLRQILVQRKKADGHTNDEVSSGKSEKIWHKESSIMNK